MLAALEFRKEKICLQFNNICWRPSLEGKVRALLQPSISVSVVHSLHLWLSIVSLKSLYKKGPKSRCNRSCRYQDPKEEENLVQR